MSHKDVKNTDLIYANQLDKVEAFTFNQQVVDVFPDMIVRSVPGYQAIIKGISELAARFAQSNSHIYDLGCSLGAVTLAMSKQTISTDVKIIGVDNSPAMIERCRNNISAYSFANRVEIIQGDINHIEFKPASVIVLNFTLQFIAPEQRQSLINKLYKALLPKGILIVSEKIKQADQSINEALIEMHHNFKRENGYSDLEIAQKRSALENVMLLDTEQQHHIRFEKSGFASSSLWFKQLNFASFIAVKNND